MFNGMFFHGSGSHRALNSFPTRRSSDLGFRKVAARGTGAIRKGDFEHLQAGGRIPALPPISPSPCGALLKVFEISDRKSTRLNSSHVEISYAVFCLKIKTL